MIDFMLFGGFVTDGRTDRRTDIGGCRVAFATENSPEKVGLRCKILLYFTT